MLAARPVDTQGKRGKKNTNVAKKKKKEEGETAMMVWKIAGNLEQGVQRRARHDGDSQLYKRNNIDDDDESCCSYSFVRNPSGLAATGRFSKIVSQARKPGWIHFVGMRGSESGLRGVCTEHFLIGLGGVSVV